MEQNKCIAMSASTLTVSIFPSYWYLCHSRILDESYHECHKGYLSLFPLLLGLLSPDSPHVGAVLDLLRSPTHLWSPYGLRSLSAAHELFGKDENYWRGNIWIQMNYLALSSLYKVRDLLPWQPLFTISRSMPLHLGLTNNAPKKYIQN